MISACELLGDEPAVLADAVDCGSQHISACDVVDTASVEEAIELDGLGYGPLPDLAILPETTGSFEAEFPLADGLRCSAEFSALDDCLAPAPERDLPVAEDGAAVHKNETALPDNDCESPENGLQTTTPHSVAPASGVKLETGAHSNENAHCSVSPAPPADNAPVSMSMHTSVPGTPSQDTTLSEQYISTHQASRKSYLKDLRRLDDFLQTNYKSSGKVPSKESEAKIQELRGLIAFFTPKRGDLDPNVITQDGLAYLQQAKLIAHAYVQFYRTMKKPSDKRKSHNKDKAIHSAPHPAEGERSPVPSTATPTSIITAPAQAASPTTHLTAQSSQSPSCPGPSPFAQARPARLTPLKRLHSSQTSDSPPDPRTSNPLHSAGERVHGLPPRPEIARTLPFENDCTIPPGHGFPTKVLSLSMLRTQYSDSDMSVSVTTRDRDSPTSTRDSQGLTSSMTLSTTSSLKLPLASMTLQDSHNFQLRPLFSSPNPATFSAPAELDAAHRQQLLSNGSSTSFAHETNLPAGVSDWLDADLARGDHHNTTTSLLPMSIPHMDALLDGSEPVLNSNTTHTTHSMASASSAFGLTPTGLPASTPFGTGMGDAQLGADAVLGSFEFGRVSRSRMDQLTCTHANGFDLGLNAGSRANQVSQANYNPRLPAAAGGTNPQPRKAFEQQHPLLRGHALEVSGSGGHRPAQRQDELMRNGLENRLKYPNSFATHMNHDPSYAACFDVPGWNSGFDLPARPAVDYDPLGRRFYQPDSPSDRLLRQQQNFRKQMTSEEAAWRGIDLMQPGLKKAPDTNFGRGGWLKDSLELCTDDLVPAQDQFRGDPAAKPGVHSWPLIQPGM